MQQLDLSVFKKAILSLEIALKAHHEKENDALIRDATIQRFEYTYELSYKMLKRYLNLSEPETESIEQLSFPALIRLGSKRGLTLHGWEVWEQYRHARNLTSHVYDEKKALQVCDSIPAFLEDAQYLLQQLQHRLQAP